METSFADLEQVLELIYDVFPLPVAKDGEKFAGRHSIAFMTHPETGNMMLGFSIWYRRAPSGKIVSQDFGPDEGESLNKLFFEQIKEIIRKRDEDNPTEMIDEQCCHSPAAD